MSAHDRVGGSTPDAASPSIWKGLSLREDVTPEDVERVREIVQSSGYFSESEIEIAVEIVEETLEKGPAAGYRFLFADHSDLSDPGVPLTRDGVCESGRRTVGYTCFGEVPCTKGSFDLYWIAVEAAQRGKGLGTLLQRETEARVRAMGGRRLFADTSGRAQYEPTRHFYLGLGYKEEARLADFYAPGDDKVLYGMRL